MFNRVKKFVRTRVLIVILALVVIVFSLMAAPSSRVRVRANGDETHITYYTDATLTTQCGYTIILCQGWQAHNGCTTPYYTVSYTPCLCEMDPC
ncbi:MAG TPA: hypothetical protein VN643_13975 [Pyrinomonadaceae bacterium]|nr:hypothetical protein [Pyrinomonadaceae bacterium]